MMDADRIAEQYEEFIGLISQDSRSEALLDMYDRRWSVQLVSAPASAQTHFHNAFPGGYLDHILNTYHAAVDFAKLFKSRGGNLDFTAEELRFAALHHDLGKLGDDDDTPYYLEQSSDWHRKKLNMMYEYNKIQYMEVPERGLSILMIEGIPVTRNEYLAIRLADGMYKDSNKSYLRNSMYPYPMKTNLPYIIHAADMMSSVIEREATMFG